MFDIKDLCGICINSVVGFGLLHSVKKRKPYRRADGYVTDVTSRGFSPTHYTCRYCKFHIVCIVQSMSFTEDWQVMIT